ncbi:MAG: hypothetical protein ACOYK8_00530 [Alphaproteobacteria bacterium]
MRLLFTIALVFFVNLTTLVQAGEYNLKSISSEDYAKLVDDACQKPAVSYWKSGITSEMREGNDIYNACLYKHIKLMMKDYFSAKSKFNAKKSDMMIRKITEMYQDLNVGFIIGEKSCYLDGNTGCYGTMFDVEVDTNSTPIYLMIIKELALGMRRGERELPPPPTP